MTFIQSYTAPNSSSYGVDWTNIPQTFTHLQVRIFVRSAGSNQDVIRVSPQNDSTLTNFRNHQLFGNGSSAGSASNQNVNGQIGYAPNGFPRSTSLANVFGAYVVDILDYTNTNKFKTIRTIGGWDDNNTSGTDANVSLSSSLWMNTAAITSLTVASVNNPIAANTRFDLYGITVSALTGA